MSDIIIGSSSWQNEAGTDASGGWNSGGSIWGSSSDDAFTYADQSWITKAAGSSAWSLDGGGGFNTLSVSNATSHVSINFSSLTVSNIDVLIGSGYGDLLGGSSLTETVEGGAGADSIWGAGSTDMLYGGTGADSYWFGVNDGTDTIADEGSDNKSDAVVLYSSSFSQLGFSLINTTDLKITVNASQGYSDSVILKNVGTYMDSNNTDRVNKFIASDITFGLSVGTAGDDSLVGSSIADYMTGEAGDDTINGGAGGDAIYGGDGDDSIVYSSAAVWLDGGNGSNTLSASSASTGVSVLLGSSTTIANFAAFVGSDSADLIGGSSNAENIYGGAGADSLWGAAGDDLLNGGTGSDSYWFGVSDGDDTIASDSSNSSDTVMFYGSGISGGGITSTIVSGYNLTIGLSSGDSLTLADWTRDTSYKVNKFNFAGYGTYSLTVDSYNSPTWTKIS